jgi:hypothetical protein
MCMSTRSVTLVANTRILARSCGAGHQVLVYSMTIDTSAELAMILPLPTKPGIEELDANFIDMYAYENFFDDLEKAWWSLHNSRSVGSGKGLSSRPTLLVSNVGSFEASFAPTRADLDRLDSRFQLDPEVWRKLPIYENFGYAVFKLRPGFKRIHPMAIKFPRRDPRLLFFPTVHVHDGQMVPPVAKFDHTLFFQTAMQVELKRKWCQSVGPASTFMRQTSLTADVMDLTQPCYLILPKSTASGRTRSHSGRHLYEVCLHH